MATNDHATVPDPPAAAVAKGHNLVWDPPAALTAASRWTCHPGCGATAIRYGRNEYGSAVEQRCPHKDDTTDSAAVRS